MYRLSTSLCFFLVAGCLSFGVDFPTDTSWVVANKTTQHDVSKKLGMPQEIGMQGNPLAQTHSSAATASKKPGTVRKSKESPAMHVWTYYYFRYSLFEGTERKELKLYWNSDHTVKSYTVTQSTKREPKKSSSSSNPSKSSSGETP